MTSSVTPITRRSAAASREPTRSKPSGKGKTKVLTAARRRLVSSIIAAIGAGFLPVASYCIVHFEASERKYLYGLVACALGYSAPSLAAWALTWVKAKTYKAKFFQAWSFTLMLEGIMTLSSNPYLSGSGLALLVAINCHSAWENTGISEKLLKQGGFEARKK